MKAVLLCLAVIAAIAGGNIVNAQSGGGCDQIVKNINNAVALIDQNATDYWTHRGNYDDLIFGPSSQVVPNAMQLANQEKGQADAIKAKLPGRVNSLKGLCRAAQAQGCLSPAQLSTVCEPSLKHGKRVNFDQFPTPGLEGKVGPGPPRMPP